MKTKVKKFNSLSLEERKSIIFYQTEAIIRELEQRLFYSKDELPPCVRKKILNRIDIFKQLLKSEYEVVE
jgi:hypothetical protein